MKALLTLALALGATDTGTDWAAKRRELAAAEGYDAYALQVTQYRLLERHRTLADDAGSSIADMNAPLQELHEAYPLSIQGNAVIGQFLAYVAGLQTTDGSTAGNDEVRVLAREFEERAKAILDSVLASGDGRAPGTAYEVINIMEEHAVLEAKGLDYHKVLVVTCDDVPYDVLLTRAPPPAAPVSTAVWFATSAFYRPEAIADPEVAAEVAAKGLRIVEADLGTLPNGCAIVSVTAVDD